MTRASSRTTAGAAGEWGNAPATLVLASHHVHVWRVFLDDVAWSLEQLTAILSPDERRRANRFTFARDRRRSAVRRGVLRLLLAGYVHSPAHAVDLHDGPRGKPELTVAQGDPPLQFNCSHSRGLALYAFTPVRRIGVDVEALRPLPEAEGIAALCFSPRERSELAALAPGRLDEAILHGWTMKEAYVKARGDGLTTPLDGIEVSVDPTGPPALRAIDGDPERASDWFLQTLSPEPGYVAAVVVEGSDGYELGCSTAQPVPVHGKASGAGAPPSWSSAGDQAQTAADLAQS